MTEEDLLDIQMENYIHNRMIESERAAFEQILNQQPTILNQVRDLVLLKSLYDKELFELKQGLESIIKNK
jgi:hypothetical protein